MSECRDDNPALHSSVVVLMVRVSDSPHESPGCFCTKLRSLRLAKNQIRGTARIFHLHFSGEPFKTSFSRVAGLSSLDIVNARFGKDLQRIIDRLSFTRF